MKTLNKTFVKRFKLKIIEFLFLDKNFEAKLLLDILCYRESCLFNKAILFDLLLVDRLKELDNNLYLELVVNLKLNKIKINTGE